MDFNYQYLVSATVLSGIVIGIVYIYLKRWSKREVFKKLAAWLILVGILLPILGVTLNSFIEDNWDMNYIVSFLFFKKVEGSWFFFFNDFCMWGYISFSWGVTMWCVTRKNDHGRGINKTKEK